MITKNAILIIESGILITKITFLYRNSILNKQNGAQALFLLEIII
nr:MAG TPA: hypothetical protein [Caudoviricetes sp.]